MLDRPGISPRVRKLLQASLLSFDQVVDSHVEMAQSLLLLLELVLHAGEGGDKHLVLLIGISLFIANKFFFLVKLEELLLELHFHFVLVRRDALVVQVQFHDFREAGA